MTDHERALLGCALTDVAVARELLRTVEHFMFEAASEQRTWAALCRVLETATGPVDLVGRRSGGAGRRERRRAYPRAPARPDR